MKTLSEYIKSRPERSMGDWADALGVKRTYLYALLDGSRHPSLETALVIAGKTNGEVPVGAWPNHAKVIEAANMGTSSASAGE